MLVISGKYLSPSSTPHLSPASLSLPPSLNVCFRTQSLPLFSSWREHGQVWRLWYQARWKLSCQEVMWYVYKLKLIIAWFIIHKKSPFKLKFWIGGRKRTKHMGLVQEIYLKNIKFLELCKVLDLWRNLSSEGIVAQYDT